jgi:hypothetical protein
MQSTGFQFDVDGRLANAVLSGPLETRETQSDLGEQVQYLIPFEVRFQEGAESRVKLVVTSGEAAACSKKLGFSLLDSSEELRDLFVAESGRLASVLQSGGDELCL